MTRSFKRFLMPAAFVMLAACSTNSTVGASPEPKMTFAHLRAMPVNVYAVNVHKIDGRTEGDFVVDPMKVAEDYARARFAPQGGPGTLEITIEEASVVKATKDSPNNVARFFDVGSTDEYNVTLRLRLEHVGQGGNIAYGKTITARRLMSITEHASVAEREAHELEGLQRMFAEMDKQIYTIVTEGMRIAGPGSY